MTSRTAGRTRRRATTAGLGPSYVATIVDAVGKSTCTDTNGQTYWQDTAIFITWDDWGGFYDHVPPPVTYTGTYQNGKWTCPAPNGWGCGYVYGFRVPLLVVSAYTPAHTISGAISGSPSYPPPPEWTHDFGSILKFAENNFFGKNAQIAPPGYTYADSNSLDAVYQGNPVVPLWDFFLGPYRNFTPILSTSPSYDANYFMNYYTTTNTTPIGPEDGDPDD
ncbi:MAG TPA: alkaline phosphatase family protein [Terriglobales bacterium]|nr:alkaline phosphatase family protein [Terriglobales bacterium]